jgi:hypothetical protein
VAETVIERGEVVDVVEDGAVMATLWVEMTRHVWTWL